VSETTSTATDSTTSTPAPSSSAEPSGTPSPSAPADATPPSSGSSDSTAPSSGDSRQSDREQLLSAVLKVVQTRPEAPALPTDGEPPVADQDPKGAADRDKAAASETGQGATPAPDETSQDKDPTEGELRKLRPETRKRFETLLSQRNEARQALATVQPELDQHRQLQGFLREHQLATDDVNRLLGVGSALRRGDYRAFLEGVTPYVMVAQEALGIRIAPDLQKQVEEGTVSEEAAREMTRVRHRANRAEHELTTTRQAQTAETQQRNVGAIRDAIDTWEAGIRTRDPDYAHKSVAVRRFSQALMQERGVPATVQQAVELVRAAYEEASREMLRGRPVPQPTRRSPSGIQTTTTGSAAREPTSMKDAALQALASMRRAS
jgi:hypothetical protein